MNIKRAFIQTKTKGDIASGNVVIDDDDKIYYLDYDTLTSPDGLTLTVVDEPGDEIRTEEHGYVEATEELVEAAHETLSQYRQEAKRGEGAVTKNQITFTGAVGFNDEWTP